MRVTNNMLTSTMITNLNKNLRKMNDYQKQLATGKQIDTPSDNPVLAAKILKYRTDLSELAQYKKNVEDAQSWLEVTEAAVADVQSVLQNARERAVQGANAVNTVEDRQKIADEIKQMRKQLISDGNTSFAGRYIFSASQNDTKFFKEDGSFNIDVFEHEYSNRDTAKFQIGIGEELEVSTNGLDIFGATKLSNLLVNNAPTGDAKGTAAIKAQLNGSFDLNQNYVGRTINITVGATNYAVDTSSMSNSLAPVTKELLTTQLKNAVDGGGVKLSTVADVYYDSNDKLVIAAKNFGTTPVAIGAGSNISGAPWSFAPTATAAINTAEAALVDTTKTITDANVAAQQGDLDFYVTYNGKREKITIDFSFLADVNGGTAASLVTKLNSEFDTKFGVGKVVASGVSGGNLTISTAGSPNDGKVPTIQMEYPYAFKSTLIKKFDDFIDALQRNDNDGIDAFLKGVDEELNNVLTLRSDIGARANRVELVQRRIDDNQISFTKLLSSAEDANMAEVVMYLKNSENVYKASLSTGGRVIQPSLIDFLK